MLALLLLPDSQPDTGTITVLVDEFHASAAAEKHMPQLQHNMWVVAARTAVPESAFDQRDLSPAKAVGLTQVTPAAGRDTAKRFGVTYNWNRLVSDPVYDTQMGARRGRCP
jgi:hypothetical protein